MTSLPGKILIGCITGIVGAGLATYYFYWNYEKNRQWNTVHALQAKDPQKPGPLPSRETLIKSLKTQSFDVVIIGGGATGAGCALDAVTRGLKTALIEADDFASGTSSKSTKLIHGGVRYLQKAIMQMDLEQYRMVKEALHERGTLLNSAPHLARPLPIMLPVYTWWRVPYFWAGIKMYDLVAGSKTIKSSYLLSKKGALELFPMLRADTLCGAIVYYDGQMDDARMNLAIILTAIRNGAAAVNHVSVTGLQKLKKLKLKKLTKSKGIRKEVIYAVEVKDEITGDKWKIPTKCVINATGPFTDTIRKMDDPNVTPICSPSSGVHITLPGYYSSEQMGLLDPATSDGRVIFFLPWQKHTIAGTTDLPCDVTHNPKPTEEEIEFILGEVRNYLNPDVEVRRGDVLSAWSGIRPLVSDPNKPNTQSLARNHIVHVSDSNLVTVAGGKWTTYRSMAQDTVDAAIKACDLCPLHKTCQTNDLLLEGAHEWTPTMYIRLVQDCGLESEVAEHLSKYYGDKAFIVAKMASPTGARWPIIGKKIHPELPFIDAEVRYGVRAEYALNSVDMIARRLRLAFLNVQATLEALPEIADIMAEELSWNAAEKFKQIKLAVKFLQNDMGQNVTHTSSNKSLIVLKKEDIQVYIKRFQAIDKDRKGYVSMNDIRNMLKEHGEKEVPGEELHIILNSIDTKMNGQVELDEYLQIMSAIKSRHVPASRTTRTVEDQDKYKGKHEELLKTTIPVERSGGGL